MEVEAETSGSPIPNDQLPRYVYKRLISRENIRLIHLEPATDTKAKIVLSLSEHYLYGRPPYAYDALSYTWGDPSNVRDITIFTPRTTSAPRLESDSQPLGHPVHTQARGPKQAFELGTWFQQEGSFTTLSVTYSCYSALRRLRSPTIPRTIWIDAICINQDDIQERNRQVAIMGTIYWRCHRLIIDVGDASPTSDAAIDFIVQYHQHREASEFDGHGVYDMTTGLHIRDIISEFYARPWFSRIWVLQEVYLGARERNRKGDDRLPALLNCGGRSVEWSKLEPLHINVDSRPAGGTENWHIELPTTVVALPLVLRIIPLRWGDTISTNEKRFWPRYKISALDTLDLLCLARSNMATDPRDKVFALLGFPRMFNSRDPIPKADYGQPVTGVYIQTAVWLLRRAGLMFLSCCGKTRENDSGILEGVPSWVPDWSDRYLKQWMIGFGDVYTPLQAGGDPPPDYSDLSRTVLAETVATTILDADLDNIGRALLKVRGVSVDKIKFVSGHINIRYAGDNECKDFVERCRLYREGLDRGFEDAAAGHMRLTGAARLPKPRQWTPKTGEKRLHPPEWAAYEYGLPLKNPETLTDNELCDYISFFTANRQLAMTDRGYFGVVPQRSAVGDQVCCFLSAGVPFVLRNRDDGTYRLIGESYIYGLMEGEAFGGADKAHGMMETQDTVPIDPLQDFLIS